MMLCCNNTKCIAWNQPVEIHWSEATETEPPYPIDDTCSVCGHAISHAELNVDDIIDVIREECDPYHQPSVINEQEVMHVIIEELRRQYQREIDAINASLPIGHIPF